jgi:hypothetical protein
VIAEPLSDSDPTVDDLDIIICPPPLRRDAARALAISMGLIAQSMDDCRRRALELGLTVHAARVTKAREPWVDAMELLGRDPR